MVESIKYLKKICHKSKSDEPYIENFLRIFSIRITKLLLYTPLSGNQVSILGMFNTLLATILFMFGNYWLSLVASVLVLLSWVIDCCDGEVTRYKRQASMRGGYLDDIGYYLIETMPLIGITLGIFRSTENFIILVFGFSAVFFLLMTRIVDLRRFVFVVDENIHNLKKDKNKFIKFVRTETEKVLAERDYTKTMKATKGEYKFLNLVRDMYRRFFYFFFNLFGFVNMIMIAALVGKFDYLIYFFGALFLLFFCFNLTYQFLKGFDSFYLYKTKELYNFNIKKEK